MESPSPTKGDDPWLTFHPPSRNPISLPDPPHAFVTESSVFEAMMQSRQRQADREIGRYLQNNKFTDEAEREIERLFLSTRF